MKPDYDHERQQFADCLQYMNVLIWRAYSTYAISPEYGGPWDVRPKYRRYRDMIRIVSRQRLMLKKYWRKFEALYKPEVSVITGLEVGAIIGEKKWKS